MNMNMLKYIVCPIKLHKILLNDFRVGALTNVFNSIFHLGKLVSSNGHKSQKNIGSKYPANMCIYTECFFITTKFHEFMLSSFRGVALTKLFQ